MVALCAFAFPSTAAAAGPNLLPPIQLPGDDPVSQLVNQTTGQVTQTVNDAVGDVVDQVLPQQPGGGSTPTVPELPEVAVPEVPGVTSPPSGGGSGGNAGSNDSPSSSGGSGGDSNSGSSSGSDPGSGSSGSDEPSASGSSASGNSGSSSPAERARERKLRQTPEGRAQLRRERAAEKREAAAEESGDQPQPAERTANKDNGGGAEPVSMNPDGEDDGGLGLPRPLERVVEVVPGPIKALLAVLFGLAIFFFGRGQLIARRAKRLIAQREELLHDVGLLQEALLPEIPERLGELRASVAYRPADGPAAGGDFYDAFPLDDDRVAIIVGDVSGHGRGALARTALMRYTLRAYLDAGLEPRKALKVAGRALDDDLGGDFATVVVAVHDPAHATLTYSSAGHPPPIVTGSGAFEPVTVLSSPPIGAGLPTGQRQTTLHLPGDATACFFTDGLIEAKIEGDLVGREKLAELVGQLDSTASADELLVALADYADETPDDMAACIVTPDKMAAVDHVPERIEEIELTAVDLSGDRVETFLAACGVAPAAAAAALKSVEASVGEFGVALLRVRIDKTGTRCDVDSEAGPHDPLGLPIVERGELRV
jgi:hypothetical protein